MPSIDKLGVVSLSEEEIQKVLQSFFETDMSLHVNEIGWNPNDKEFALMSLRNSNMLGLRNAPEQIPQDELNFFNSLSKQLEDKGLIELTGSYQYIFTKEAIEELSEALAKRLEQGEITKEEYERALRRFKQMLNLDKKRYELLDNEIPVVLTDILKVQDSLSMPIDVQDMYVHYLLDQNKEKGVASGKTDYRKLQVLIHYLFKKD